jgi:hypothetical protein
MSDNLLVTQLNNLLINIDKSLLQYAGEVSLWTAIDAEEEREIYHSLVARQKSNSGAIIDIILERRWELAQGTYPTEYTDLHFVAFDYLATEIAKNEQMIVEKIKETKNTFSDDTEISALLERVLEETLDNIQQLNKVSSNR